MSNDTTYESQWNRKQIFHHCIQLRYVRVGRTLSHSRCSKWAPLRLRMSGSRTCWKFSMVRSTIATVTCSISSLMAFLSCWLVAGLPLYTLSFKWPQSMKSRGDNGSDNGTMGPGATWSPVYCQLVWLEFRLSQHPHHRSSLDTDRLGTMSSRSFWASLNWLIQKLGACNRPHSLWWSGRALLEDSALCSKFVNPYSS